MGNKPVLCEIVYSTATDGKELPEERVRMEGQEVAALHETISGELCRIVLLPFSHYFRAGYHVVWRHAVAVSDPRDFVLLHRRHFWPLTQRPVGMEIYRLSKKGLAHAEVERRHENRDMELKLSEINRDMRGPLYIVKQTNEIVKCYDVPLNRKCGEEKRPARVPPLAPVGRG